MAVSLSEDLMTIPFFNSAAAVWGIDGLETCSIYDVLSTDPYYANSYSSKKFEQLGSIAQYPPHKQRGEEQEGNCVLISGSWTADERYEITLNTTNPVAIGEEVGVWVSMIQYQKELRPDGSGYDLSFLTRGPKHGATCSVHPRLLGGNNSMRVVNASDPAATSWPSAPMSISTPPLCQDGFAPSLRYGGECVSCDSEIAYSGVASPTSPVPIRTPCICRSDQLSLPIGPVACRNATISSSSTLVAMLPSSLCSLFLLPKRSAARGIPERISCCGELRRPLPSARCIILGPSRSA